MNDLLPFGNAGDVLADDLLLDRIARGADTGSEPVAGLLAALAAHADTPMPARAGRRRIANKHRYLGAFAALAVAASGAGVAAAVTQPHQGSLLADRARIEQRMEQSARSSAPSALLSRLGLPSTDATVTARGLVLARGAGGTFVLLPAAAAQARTPAAVGAAAKATGAGSRDADGTGRGLGAGRGSAFGPSAPGGSVAAASAPGRDKAPKDAHAKPAKSRPGAETGNRPVGNGHANGQTGDPAPPTGSDSIWVVDPSTGTTGSTADPATAPTAPTETTVAGPAPVGSRFADPANQQSLVGPSLGPQPRRQAEPPETLPPAASAGTHPAGATPATPADPATRATPATPATPARPATPGERSPAAAAPLMAPGLRGLFGQAPASP